MAKTKTTPVQEEQLITLTKEQFQKLLQIRELLDDASDALNDIDGEETAFSIGKSVGSVYSDLILAYNELSEVLMGKQSEIFSNDFEDEDEN